MEFSVQYGACLLVYSFKRNSGHSRRFPGLLDQDARDGSQTTKLNRTAGMEVLDVELEASVSSTLPILAKRYIDRRVNCKAFKT